ncbi:MAG: hypothetical protein AAGH64_09030, partial [Planctomycetota bacterium]
HALFAQTLFITPSDEELKTFENDWTIINCANRKITAEEAPEVIGLHRVERRADVLTHAVRFECAISIARDGLNRSGSCLSTSHDGSLLEPLSAIAGPDHPPIRGGSENI